MAHSDHDAVPLLSGAVPGLFDSSQPSRVLRTPTCSLFFAAFDPHTARADVFPNVSGLRIDPGSSSKDVNPETAASTNGKRVVIETDAENGTCTWRFVPRAKTEGGPLGDEGPWPRVVALCGRLVRMTQDQWDIHKLDPEYDCTVHAQSSYTTITRVSQSSTVQPDPTSPDNPVTPTMAPSSLEDNAPTPKATRDISPTSETSGDVHKKQKSPLVDPDRMCIDEDTLFTPSTPVRNGSHTNTVVHSKKRRRVSERLGSTSASDSGYSKRESGKRAESSVFADLSFNSRSHNPEKHDARDFDVPPTPVKRFRTRSPDGVRREMEQKRLDREKKRKADMDARLRARRDALREAFWKDIGVVPLYDETIFPQTEHTDDFEASADDGGSSDTSSEPRDDEKEERLAKIEESRRKLAELDKDKPLWEESARRRQQKEAEEEFLRQREKARREEQARFQEQIKAAQKQREEQWEQERKEREQATRIREQSGRMFITQPRNSFRWNSRLALERYIQAATDFDAAKFTAAEKPISFAQVPWPVLHASYSVQDVDWDTVEAFFGEVERFLTPADFKVLVEKSHRRFHPDRWRSRGLLVTVQNETERDLLEVAGSTVAQALTPLWKEVTGRV